VLLPRCGRADLRHDLEQDCRPDGYLPGEGAAVGGKQDEGHADCRGKDRQDNPIGRAIVAVDQGDGNKREPRLHEQHDPLYSLDRGLAGASGRVSN
jgi:hypothetical protein